MYLAPPLELIQHLLMFSHMAPCHLHQPPQPPRCQTGCHPITFFTPFSSTSSSTSSPIQDLEVRVKSIYIGAPMYADDLALIVDSPQELQAMLNIVHSYAGKWQYNLNTSKSFIMVFGESPCSRTRARPLQEWHLGSEKVQEADEVHHLGIL